MTKASWRKSRSPWVWAIAMIVGLPAIADAQLFPNLNVRRQRPACVQEPPFNAHVRRDYFGYYPTCWSRFPAGWACPCPNPELPDPTAEFRVRPRSAAPALGPETDPDAAPGAAPTAPGDARDEAELPAMPNTGRSPFDNDNPVPGARPTAPDATPPARTPGSTTPAPIPTPGSAPGPNASASTGLIDLPPVPSTATAIEPGSLSFPSPDAAVKPSANVASATPAVGSPLGVPDPRLGASPIVEEAPPAAATAAPAQAPARRSFVGGLFNMGNRRRR